MLWPEVIACTLVGSRRSRAMYGMLSVWQAMSPRAPVPNAHQPRHFVSLTAGRKFRLVQQAGNTGPKQVVTQGGQG